MYMYHTYKKSISTTNTTVLPARFANNVTCCLLRSIVFDHSTSPNMLHKSIQKGYVCPLYYSNNNTGMHTIAFFRSPIGTSSYKYGLGLSLAPHALKSRVRYPPHSIYIYSTRQSSKVLSKALTKSSYIYIYDCTRCILPPLLSSRKFWIPQRRVKRSQV